MQKAVRTHEFKTKTEVGIVTADKIYGTADNYKYLKGKNALACISHQHRGSIRTGMFGHEKFHYDRVNDCFICPANQKLLRYDHKRPYQACPNTWGIRYRAKRQACEQCHFFSQCVLSKKWGRQIVRNVNAEYVEWADHCLSKHDRKRLRARRQYKMEGSFADAANNYGFKRARWRGLAKMQMQNLMIAAIQNLGKLMRYGGCSRKTRAALMAIKDGLYDIKVILHRLDNIFAIYERI